ncbi:MAG: DUF4199 domain-containing protein [Bacteroidota bacterium]
MSQSTPSKMNIALKWGMIGLMISIIQSMGFYLLDFDNQMVSFLCAIAILSIVSVMAINAYKDENGGFASFGQGFTTSFFTMLVLAVAGFAWTYLFFEVIAPEARQEIIDNEVVKMQARGLDDDQIEKALVDFKFFFSTIWFCTIGVVVNIVVGTIISLITGAILKEENPNPGLDQFKI